MKIYFPQRKQIESGSALSVLLSTTVSVLTNVVVDKSTDNAEPLSICFLPQCSTPKKVFISERDQNHDTKKELFHPDVCRF